MRVEILFLYICFYQKPLTISTNGYHCHFIPLWSISLDVKYSVQIALVKEYQSFHTPRLVFPLPSRGILSLFPSDASRYDCNSMWCKVAMEPASVARSHIQYPAWRLKPARIWDEEGGHSYRCFSYFVHLFADYLLAVWCPITDSNDYMPDSRIAMGTGRGQGTVSLSVSTAVRGKTTVTRPAGAEGAGGGGGGEKCENNFVRPNVYIHKKIRLSI